MKARQRITVETRKLMQDPPAGVSACARPDNWRYFDVILEGPSGSPYEGGIFRLELFLPEEYPAKPPKARMLTRIYHPNIDKLGRICLSTLKEQTVDGGWRADMSVYTTLVSIQALLSNPNPEDPLDTQVAEHWKADTTDAEARAREWTRQYADG